MITASTGTTDVVLAAMLALAVLSWRRPSASSAVITAAAWFKLAPAALLPVWIAPLRGRALRRALGAIALVSAPVAALVVALGGLHGIGAMVHAISFQISRGSHQSLWAALGVSGVQPLGQALVLAVMAGAAVKCGYDGRIAADPARIAALAAAILIGVQLAADYWSFLYLVWVFPLLCQSLLSAGETVGAPASAVSPSSWRARAALAP